MKPNFFQSDNVADKHYIRLMHLYTSWTLDLKVASNHLNQLNAHAALVEEKEAELSQDVKGAEQELHELTTQLKVLTPVLPYLNYERFPFLLQKLKEVGVTHSNADKLQEIEQALKKKLPVFKLDYEPALENFMHNGYNIKRVKRLAEETSLRQETAKLEQRYLKKLYEHYKAQSARYNNVRHSVSLLKTSIEDLNQLIVLQQNNEQIKPGNVTNASTAPSKDNEKKAMIIAADAETLMHRVDKLVMKNTLHDDLVKIKQEKAKADEKILLELEEYYADERFDEQRRWNDCKVFINSAILKLNKIKNARLKENDLQTIVDTLRETILHMREFRYFNKKEFNQCEKELVQSWRAFFLNNKSSAALSKEEPLDEKNKQCDLLANTFFELKDYIKAFDLYRIVLKNYPNHTHTLLKYSHTCNIFARQSENPDLYFNESITACNRLLHRLPWLGHAHHLKSVALMDRDLNSLEIRENIVLAYRFRDWLEAVDQELCLEKIVTFYDIFGDEEIEPTLVYRI